MAQKNISLSPAMLAAIEKSGKKASDFLLDLVATATGIARDPQKRRGKPSRVGDMLDSISATPAERAMAKDAKPVLERTAIKAAQAGIADAIRARILEYRAASEVASTIRRR